MTLDSFLYSLASVPMFAARPFLAALVTALLARFGDDVPFLRQSDVIQSLAQCPEWFQSFGTIAVLAALAAGEYYATKNADVREAMQELDGWIKSGVSLLVTLALVDRETATTIDRIQRHGLSIESTWAVVCAAATYGMTFLRRAALWVIHEVDDDDDIGLQTMLTWVESTWTVTGLLFIVVFPVVALVLSALTALGLWWARRWKERREERAKTPCASCGTPIFLHATRCHACGREQALPRAVGVFGTPKTVACEDVARQRFDLIARKRCPVCATRLRERAVQQACPTCRTVTFATRQDFEEYLDVLGARLPKTLLVSLGFSAIPIVGVVPGVAYYRLNAISGLRGYVPPLRGCVARSLLFFVRWILIALQPIPLVGALVIPLMFLASWGIYRRALVGRARRDLAPAASAAA